MNDNGFPNQRVSESVKIANDNEWGKETIDQLVMNGIPFSGGHYYGEDSTWSDDRYGTMVSNYMLYNNVINQQDFERECNPLGLTVGEFKDEIKPYNKTYNKIQVLLGEELKRPFDYSVVVSDTESIRSKMMEHDKIMQEKSAGLMSKIQAIISQYLGRTQGEQGQLTPEEEQQMQEEMNQEIDKFFSPEQLKSVSEDNFLVNRETAARKLLKYFQKVLNLTSLKNDGFKHALISGDEINWVGTFRGEPVIRNVNPLSYFGWKHTDEKYYQNGLYGGMSSLMKKETVINQFGDFLSEEKIEEIQQGIWGVGSQGSSAKSMRYAKDSPVDAAFRRAHRGHSNYGQYGNTNSENVLSDEWEVYHVE